MSEKREMAAMSLLLAAIEVYGANYNAVRTTLENWITMVSCRITLMCLIA